MPAVKSQPAPTPLARARSITDSLFGQVQPEAFFDRPIPERHRILSTSATSRPLIGT